MATRFWVGGNGVWDTVTTTNWSTTSGGSGGASVPTSTDDVVFDSNSSSNSYTVTIAQNTTVVNLTINGISAIKRLFLCSSILGTARTLTATTVTASNVDFMDIIGAGAGSWNLSAISGGSGTCGGNGGITFTTPATQYWRQTVTGQKNWSDVNNWANASGGAGGTGRVPLPQDTARFDANSFTTTGCEVVQDYPRTGSIDWTGATNNPRWNTNTLAGGIDFAIFGSMTLISAMNPFALLGYVGVALAGRGNYTLTRAGQIIAFPHFTVAAPGGTYTCQDDFSLGQAGVYNCNFHVLSGTFNTNGQVFKATSFGTAYFGGTSFTSAFTSTSVPPTLTMGSSTWTIFGYDSIAIGESGVFNVISTATVNSGTSTIVFDDSASSGAKTFVAGAQIFNNLTYTGTGSGSFTVTRSAAGSINLQFNGNTIINNTGGSTVNIASVNFTSYNNLNFTGFTGTLTSTASTYFVRGDIIFVPTFTFGTMAALTLSPPIIGGATNTITSNGVTYPGSITVSCSTGNTKKLNDDLSLTVALSILSGSFDSNNKNVTCGSFSGSGTNIRSVSLGSSTITTTATSGTIFNNDVITNLTWNAGTSTIVITGSGASARTIRFGALTYYNFWFNTTGSQLLSLVGSATFNDFKVTTTTPIQFTAGTTQTVSSLTATGSAGNLITLKSSINGSYWQISKSSGTVNCDYLSLQDSHAIGGATFNAGSNSVNVSGNTGWIFGTATSNNFFLMF